MNCQQFRQIIDSYISDELLAETNRDVLRHLETCPACRAELAAGRNLRNKTRFAVINSEDAQINPVFARHLQANLRQTALPSTLWEKLKAGNFIADSPIFAAAIAACLVFGVLFGLNALRPQLPAPDATSIEQSQFNNPVENLSSPEKDSSSIVKAAWRETTGKAVGDHKNCALYFHLKEKPISLDEAAAKFGAFNKNLEKTIKAALRGEVSAVRNKTEVDEKIEILAAHSCVFEGRRFAHIILRKDGKTISLLVAESDSFDGADGAIASEPIENLQVAGFSAARHAVFVISDLSKRENMNIAEQISPAIRRYIEQPQA